MKKNYLNSILKKIHRSKKYRNECLDCIKSINKENRTMKKEEKNMLKKEYRDNTKNLKRLYHIDYRERNREKIQLYKKK